MTESLRRPEDCHHDDTFNGVCVYCRSEVGTTPTDEQARIVGDLLGMRLTRKGTDASALLADARAYARLHGCCPFCGAFMEDDGTAVCDATLDHPEAWP